MTQGTHHSADDPRNRDILIYVNGELRPRGEALVSVFDSGFILGDGVWEGLRVHRGRIAFLDAHLDRLYEAAKAIDLDIGTGPRSAHGGALSHARGEPYERRRAHAADGHPRPEEHARTRIRAPASARPPWSSLPNTRSRGPKMLAQGVRLFTVHVRRGAPDVQDPKLNSHSKLNCITACIQATKAGADEALMLDPHGFVATCNSTHFFIVRGGEVWTSTGDYCLAGITRANVLRLCRENGITRAREEFQSHRGLCGAGGLRDRHIRRHRTGHRDRWSPDQRRAADPWSSACSSSTCG